MKEIAHGFSPLSDVIEKASLDLQFGNDDEKVRVLAEERPFTLKNTVKQLSETIRDIIEQQEARSHNAWFDKW